MLAGMLGTGIGWLLLAAASGASSRPRSCFGLGLFVLDFGAMVFFINYLTLRQAVTPGSAARARHGDDDLPYGGDRAFRRPGRRLDRRACGIAGDAAHRGPGRNPARPARRLGLSALRLRTLDEAQEPRQTESVAEELAG